jgi:mannose-6-phosphate isomerase-like protein (cupin superfamily)
MKIPLPCLLTLTFSAAAVTAHAQVTQSKQSLTLEGAKTVAAAAAAEAKRGNEGASIAIVDDGGNLMYLERIQPTFPMGATISTEKARTAALFQKPTKILEDAIVSGRTPLLNAWSAPLIEVADYKIHASRRDGPGIAEVHTRDTDIAYVLEGSATLITGGRAVGLQPVASEELRGRAIEGGETRELVKGDVVVIPNGVPHWFKEVKAPFLYYVVKVRQADRSPEVGVAP